MLTSETNEKKTFPSTEKKDHKNPISNVTNIVSCENIHIQDSSNVQNIGKTGFLKTIKMAEIEETVARKSVELK